MVDREFLKFHNQPEPIQRQLLDVASRLRAAKVQIEDHNYGLAAENVREALERLPWDNGQYDVWVIRSEHE